MSKLSDPSLIYRTSSQTVSETLAYLRKQGFVGKEGVVLWAGRVADGICEVSQAIFPKQVTGPLYYRIPEDETFRIVKYVSERGLVIPIQVHSHPGEAFHSTADDERAFVQHENAVSIVVPDFAHFPDSKFLHHVRVYRLLAGNRWREMPPKKVKTIFKIEDVS